MRVIWAYTGRRPTVSHGWDGTLVGTKRKALCGRLIPNTGDDDAVSTVECGTCLRIMKALRKRNK